MHETEGLHEEYDSKNQMRVQGQINRIYCGGINIYATRANIPTSAPIPMMLIMLILCYRQ